MKRIFKSIVIVFTILFLLVPFNSFADDSNTDLKEHVKQEEGSLFEKIIAECIRWYCSNSNGFNNIRNIKCSDLKIMIL